MIPVLCCQSTPWVEYEGRVTRNGTCTTMVAISYHFPVISFPIPSGTHVTARHIVTRPRAPGSHECARHTSRARGARDGMTGGVTRVRPCSENIILMVGPERRVINRNVAAPPVPPADPLAVRVLSHRHLLQLTATAAVHVVFSRTHCRRRISRAPRREFTPGRPARPDPGALLRANTRYLRALCVPVRSFEHNKNAYFIILYLVGASIRE